MKRAPRSLQHHVLYRKYNGQDSEISALLGKCGSVVHLYPAQLERLQLSVPPTVEEQQKIADCLTALDDLIRVHGARVEALKVHKRGLMQQLFPQEAG